jgi:hypothetical protein
MTLQSCVYRAAKERAAIGTTASDTAATATPAYATDEVEQGPATVAFEALQEVILVHIGTQLLIISSNFSVESCCVH